MNSFFRRRLPLQFVSPVILSSSRLVSVFLRRVDKSKANLVYCSCSYSSHVNELTSPSKAQIRIHLRNILESRETYHFALFEVQRKQQPERFQISNHELLHDLQDWASEMKTLLSNENNDDEDGYKFGKLNKFVEPRPILADKLEKCETSDVFRVLGFCLNVIEECQNKKFKEDPARDSPNLIRVIDNSLAKKIKLLNINDALLMADMWTFIWNPMYLKCTNSIVNVLMTHWQKMDDYQLLFTFYLISVMNQSHYFFLKNASLQAKLCNLVSQLSIDEVAIIGYAFCNSGIKISHQELKQLIIDRTAMDFDKAHEQTIRMLLLIINYSFDRADAPALVHLVDKIIPELYKLSPHILARVLKLVAMASTSNKIIDEIIGQAELVLDQFHLADLNRMLLNVYGHCNNEKFIYMIIDEIKKRTDELKYEPKQLIQFTHTLVLMGILSVDFIKLSLSPENVDTMLTTYKSMSKNRRLLGFHLAMIDGTVELELPDYDGPRLSLEMRKNFASAWNNVHMGVIVSSLRKLYGSKNFAYKILLPHYHRKFYVVGFDHGMNAVAASQEWINTSNLDSFTYPPDNKNIWTVAHLIFKRHKSAKGDLLALPKAAERHLTKLGFHVAQIEFSSLDDLNTEGEKQMYIRDRMEDKAIQFIRQSCNENTKPARGIKSF